MNHPESRLQISCVTWFRYQYPKLSKLLIAVPNGGKRRIREATIMKAEGVTAGVTDLLLLTPRHGAGCLGIEMKIGKAKQSANQLEWQERFEQGGNRYEVVRTLDEFMSVIRHYLNEGK